MGCGFFPLRNGIFPVSRILKKNCCQNDPKRIFRFCADCDKGAASKNFLLPKNVSTSSAPQQKKRGKQGVSTRLVASRQKQTKASKNKQKQTKESKGKQMHKQATYERVSNKEGRKRDQANKCKPDKQNFCPREKSFRYRNEKYGKEKY